jgi:hypothetical protein
MPHQYENKSYRSANRNNCIYKWLSHVKRMDRTSILRMAVELKCEVKRPMGQSRRRLFTQVLEDIRKEEGKGKRRRRRSYP